MGKTEINDKLVQFAWWALATIVFTLVAAIRIRLLGIPLERDEGEYAYPGQLILQGIPPYKLAYNMKVPGTYAVYALIVSIFGQGIHAIYLGLLLVNVATIALIFFVGRRLVNTMAGICCSELYRSVCESVRPWLGCTLDQFCYAARSRRNTAPAQAAASVGFRAVTTKTAHTTVRQPALLFIPFGAIYIIWNDLNPRLSLNTMRLRILIFVTAAVVPLGVTSVILWRAGVHDKFSTINYAWQYGSLVPLSQAPRIFFRSANEVVLTGWPVWIPTGIGALTGLWDQRMRGGTLFFLGFLFFSALALCPGFYFRTHYFVVVLPAVSLLAGTAISRLTEILEGRLSLIRFIPLFVFAVALSVPILLDQKNLLRDRSK